LTAPTKFRFFTKQIANKHAYTNYIDATKIKARTYTKSNSSICFEDGNRENIIQHFTHQFIYGNRSRYRLFWYNNGGRLSISFIAVGFFLPKHTHKNKKNITKQTIESSNKTKMHSFLTQQANSELLINSIGF